MAGRAWIAVRGALTTPNAPVRNPVAASVGLWVGFALVHAWFILAAYSLGADALGDLRTAYLPWIKGGYDYGEWVSLNVSGVYPPLATLVMALPGIFGLERVPYEIAWLVMIVLLDAAAFFVLTRNGRSRIRNLTALWWLVFLLCLGPVAIGRLETVTVPLAIMAVTVVRRHPVVAGVLLTAGAWIKIWPGAMLAAAVLGLRSRWRLVLAALASSAALLVVGTFLGGGLSSMFAFLGGQASRSLQIEAVVATPWMVGISADAPGARIVYNSEINTMEVYADGVKETAAAMPIVLLVVVLLAIALGVLAAVRGAEPMRVFGASAIALTAAFVVCNAVGSPQFTAWIAPVAVLALLHRADPWRWAVAGAALVLAGLTQGIYPWTYGFILQGDPFFIGLLVAKSVCWVAILGYGLFRLGRLAFSGPRPGPRPGSLAIEV